MYVCICKAVTDTQIKQAIHDGAHSLRKIRNELGAMSQCGKCYSLTKSILKETLAEIKQYDSAMFYCAA